MNKLPAECRVQILTPVVEGMSIRTIARVTGASKNTIIKILEEAGEACGACQDKHIQNLKTKRIQCDEIWSFTYAKAKNVETAKKAPEDAGDTWTWTALDADSKLIVSPLVGGRDARYATEFMQDIARRLANRAQLTTDGHRAYLEAVEDAFGADVDYAQLVKLYGTSPESAKGRYSPAECTGSRPTAITGKPDRAHISTSFVGRQNLTMRMHMRRFTRLADGSSKKLENHVYMVALYTVWYNFVRIHKTLRISPAMAASLTDRLWSTEGVDAAIDVARLKPGKRGPYKKLAA